MNNITAIVFKKNWEFVKLPVKKVTKDNNQLKKISYLKV